MAQTATQDLKGWVDFTAPAVHDKKPEKQLQKVEAALNKRNNRYLSKDKRKILERLKEEIEAHLAEIREISPLTSPPPTPAVEDEVNPGGDEVGAGEDEGDKEDQDTAVLGKRRAGQSPLPRPKKARKSKSTSTAEMNAKAEIEKEKKELKLKALSALAYPHMEAMTSSYNAAVNAKKGEDHQAVYSEVKKCAETIKEIVKNACAIHNITMEAIGWPKASATAKLRDALEEDGAQIDYYRNIVLFIGMKPAAVNTSTKGKKVEDKEAEKPKFWDYETNDYVELDNIIAKRIRETPGSYQGFVTLGYSEIQKVFQNIQSNEKCLYCCGTRSIKNHDDQDHTGHDCLGCGGRKDLAVVDLFMTKISALVEGITPRNVLAKDVRSDDPNVIKPQRQRIHQEALKMVSAVIRELSGHSSITLMNTREDRLAYTAMWALKRLRDYYESSTDNAEVGAELTPVIESLELFMDGSRKDKTYIDCPDTWAPL
ncbi:hypothetical protein BDN70DRAFT_936369 [Pholiota conissans]|uniref:Uncharacterized protein n=1 Tax=Pholiota conissans TaxID=109636 RepID=A0A9P5YSV1_9AGAR|nr:hypothetical protein BDN70DRAFT_936369 [Pholiota conissans]